MCYNIPKTNLLGTEECKMNRSDKIEKEIREYWFKNHKANITNYGDVCVLDWRNPESNNYQTKYVYIRRHW